MKDLVELYLGHSAFGIIRQYSGSKDRYLVGIDFACSDDDCLKDIPFIDMSFEYSGLDGEDNFEMYIEEYKNKEDKIVDVIKKYKSVLCVFGLGGTVGSTLYIYISDLCRKMNIKCDAICSIPFNFEGYRRSVIRVARTLNMGCANNVIPVDLTYVNKKVPNGVPMIKEFLYVDYLMAKCVEYYEKNDVNSSEIEANGYYINVINKLDDYDEKTFEAINNSD